MKKISKGEYGYLKAARNRTILIATLVFVVAVAIYFGALYVLGTNQNWFTILAVLILLPDAKLIVSAIMYLKATGCSEQAHTAIARYDNAFVHGYDLYMTNDREDYALSHVVIANGSVIGLTESPKCNANNAQNHMRRMMQGNGYHGYTVKVFQSLHSYVERLDVLTPSASNQDQEVLQLLEQISL